MQNITIPEKYKNTFDLLNSTHHTTRECVNLSIWPAIAPSEKTSVTTREFWLLNDVLETVKDLDTETYQSRSTIGNILREYAPKEMSPNEKFKLFDNHIYVMGITDEKLTAEISRYAAWAIMKEINTKHDTTFNQEYFLTPNPNLGKIFGHVRHISRIAEREKTKEQNRTINGILYNDLHTLPTYGALFYDNLYKSLFGGHSIQSIQKYYHISDNTPIADYMTPELIATFASALKKIVQRYHNLSNKSYDNLYQITTKEMKTARKIFTDNHDTPEANICTTPVHIIKTDRVKREQAFINKYICERVR